MKQQKIKLAIEIIEEILDETNLDYDIYTYQYRRAKWKDKILIGVTFPDLLSKSHATRLANYIAKYINAYVTKVIHIQSNVWYMCWDVGTKI